MFLNIHPSKPLCIQLGYFYLLNSKLDFNLLASKIDEFWMDFGNQNVTNINCLSPNGFAKVMSNNFVTVAIEFCKVLRTLGDDQYVP